MEVRIVVEAVSLVEGVSWALLHNVLLGFVLTSQHVGELLRRRLFRPFLPVSAEAFSLCQTQILNQ